MKLCSACKIKKEHHRFNIKIKDENGDVVRYQSKCIECNKEYQRRHYNKNKKRYQSKSKEWKRSKKSENHNFLYNHVMKRGGCKECGEKDYACIQFDHKDGSDKKSCVSFLVSSHKPLSVIKEEIEKCDILCANCHAKRTAKQFGWYSGYIEAYAK
jgi:Tfp pilus assembly protein PilE